ncbi:ATP-dependent RNA helicase DEAH11, chloroplastic-like [Durio zibethinus]|uniref:RNA helicase n=1 Tax=Durio zibethinus TaxID=66656 RepID=A0A6P5YMF7_DURZI|nr:ATP-dependent RNA helicase DEAH11, chloroplastic-like [Durio zibethinus]
MKNFSSYSNHRHPPSPGGHIPYRHDQHSNRNDHHQRPNFPVVSNQNHRRRHPPSLHSAVGYTNSNILPLPNFIIELLHESSSPFPSKPNNLQAIISQLNPSPESFEIRTTGKIAAYIYFREWSHTLSSILSLWRSRLDGSHQFTPNVISNVLVPSDTVELKENLRTLFSDHIKGLMEGELAKKWQKKIEELSDEIVDLSGQMGKRHYQVGRFSELNDKKKALMAERLMISKRLREFKGGMRSLLGCLEDGEIGNEEEEEGVDAFRLDGGFDWKRIHKLILRECRRLEYGLPIYAHRKEILTRIHREQIMVLIGETGSGKSTQLVQFLADSGIAADESIICTQPRKIAAISLAERVREESIGCYDDNSVICYPTFSSAQQFDSKIIYMTDHCLLQHYMKDRDLSGISCIIVDEAHERSLNTDLLLSLVKGLLGRRLDLRLIIMSATANANQLSQYFFDCGIFHVIGRNFPVDIKYVPCATEGTSSSGVVASYVSDVMRMAVKVHKTEKEGNILAFLTSQMEVEWACEHFEAPNAVALPLHGKLSFDEQFHVFQNYHGKRKVVFATNIAETSLTIPGIKYVIDSGMVKESKFEPGTGMNVLKVCWISQSSANQRAGRAGRTEPGRCYRLYTESDFESMPPNQEPEIRRVHLGVAVLRILALGIKNVQSFDFVDAPSSKAIDMATRNLIQLGAIVENNGVFELTDEGRYLVKLGIEPRLGKLILSCFPFGLRREGLVLAAVMANSSSIFCRVGNDDDKIKADCLKVQFCHRNGDLFTLLSVYKEWEALPHHRKNKWCWENSINAKSMRRCQDTVTELEMCLQKELAVIIPSYLLWDPHKSTEHDKCLKAIILSSLAENVAMYSGYDQLGYEVALTGQHVQLHPSCSLLIFGQKPSWVVFSELLSITNQYLVCVTAFDFESLATLHPPPLFDVCKMESHKLQVKALTGFGSTQLKKFCGRSNHNLRSLLSRIRTACMDERIGIQVNIEQNEILLFASSMDMQKVLASVNEVLECERKWLLNECMEQRLFRGPSASPSMALFGAGAEIKHLEVDKRSLTVDVFHSNVNNLEDKELLMFFEKYSDGSICSVHKSQANGQESDDKEKWGKITFLTPDAARKAAELDGVDFAGSPLKVLPSRISFGGDHKMFSFPAVKAKVYWPRRASKGFGVIRCDLLDVGFIIDDFSNLVIGGKFVRCEVSRKSVGSVGSVVIYGIDKELSEAEVWDALQRATERKIHDFFLVRGDAVENPTCGACEEALQREISPFMPKRNLHTNYCRVQVFQPEPKETFMKALITFDGRLHLEAAKALEQLEGKVLPGCLSWQKIRCQQVFHTSISCSSSVYAVIKKQLDSLLASFRRLKGVDCNLEANENGSYRVRISANATKTVAELRRPVEELMNGRNIEHASLTPSILQHLFSRDGIYLMRSLQRETKTYISFDRHSLNVRIFGSPEDAAVAQQKLIQSLLSYHESKQLEVRLHGPGLPPDLMKKVVKKFRPDLHGLKEKIPGAEFTLSTRHHVISVRGDKETKRKVEEIVLEIAETGKDLAEGSDSEVTCPVCLCEVEDGYKLEGCSHFFCRLCLVEQCESAIKNLDSFPICCAHQGCKVPIFLTDLKFLLSTEKLEELFRAALGAFVASSRGTYRFCPSPDCPSVYRVADPETFGEPFVCGACYAETCTRCHMEYHPYLSCEKYREFKDDPDSSLKEWCKGKEQVKTCPICGYTIEKIDGCNHVECKCGRHVCWVCLEFFSSSDDCYGHLRAVHMAII